MSIILTKSYNTSTLPIARKTADICPIIKGSGSCFTPENYRPIALTSVVCKIIESINKNLTLFIYLLLPFFLLINTVSYPSAQHFLLYWLQFLIGSIPSAFIVILIVFFSILVKPLTPYHIANYFGNCHIILPIQHVLPGLKSFLLTVIKQLRLNLHYLVQGADV